MILRLLREEDLRRCLDIQPGRMGAELVGRPAALRAWSELTRSRSFNAVVIESGASPQGCRIVGFGASVFVSPAFARDEIANPRPGLNARIVASIVNGCSVILSEPDLRSANTGGDLDLVILYASFQTDAMSAQQLSEGYTLMGASFLGTHVGYRINQMMNEVVDEIEREYNERTHSWQEISTYEDFWARETQALWAQPRALHVIQRDAFFVNGSMINLLFLRRTPVLQLRDTDQELLTAALDGLTDEDLALQLGKNLPTIKKRWISLFERTLEHRPDLFPEARQDHTPKRGKQKRHHLLAYVRSHPEELRPVDTTARAT